MKVARLRFNRPETARAYREALRQRMYTAGFEPHQVTEWFRDWFPGARSLTGYVAGTADAERACDVANEVRGVMCKLEDVS